jgi:ABC-2 type transport system ATP-binding protein
MVSNLRDLGKTILLTTHYMDEAQHLADRIAVIVDGKIVAEGSPDELISGDSDTSTISFSLPPKAPPLPDDIASSAHSDGATIRIETADAMRALNRLTSWAIEKGIELQRLSVARATLEDVYLRLTAGAERKEEQKEPEPTGRRRRGRR